MDLPAPPRSSQEVRFFVDETPCDRCGKRGVKDGSYNVGRYAATCVHCGLRRTFHFSPVSGDTWANGFQLAPDVEPSKIFSAEALREIADRELARVPVEPAALPTMETFRDARRRLERARTALVELRKFRPDDQALSAELDGVITLHDAYMQAEPVIDAKVGAHAKPVGLDGRFIAHRKWLDRGKAGDGQLIFRGETWSDISMSTPLLTAAVFEDSTFTNINLSHGTFIETELRRTRFLDCDLQMSRIERVAFERCDLTGSRVSLADLLDVVGAGGDWQRLVGGRSTWRGRFHDIDLRGSQLRDSILDETTFQTCDLRGVDVSRKDVHLTALGTARRTRFTDCDLRGLNVEGWRLDDTVFERCRMHGLEGTPVLEGDVQIVDCDFSANGDGGPDDVGGARVLASWRKGGAS